MDFSFTVSVFMLATKLEECSHGGNFKYSSFLTLTISFHSHHCCYPYSTLEASKFRVRLISNQGWSAANISYILLAFLPNKFHFFPAPDFILHTFYQFQELLIFCHAIVSLSFTSIQTFEKNSLSFKQTYTQRLVFRKCFQIFLLYIWDVILYCS